MTVTSSEFLEKVKRAVTIPASQIRFSDANILEFADEETQATILPALLSIRQEFLVRKDIIPIVSEQAEYKIPYRAIGRTLRAIKIATTDDQVIRNLAHVVLDEAYQFSPNLFGEPMAFRIQGENVVLMPIPSVDSGQYVIWAYYELAPSNLVDESECSAITSFDAGTGVVNIASSITGFTSGAIMDIIDYQTGNSVKKVDITNVSVAGTVVTFDPDDLPSDLAVGDYLALSNETPVIQLPEELHQSLVQAVVCRLLEAQGDFEGLQAAEMKLGKKLEAAMVLLTPRVEGSPQVVICRTGLLRQRPYNYRFR